MKNIFLFVLLCIYQNIYAQEITVLGTITNNQLQPIETVLVQVRNKENVVLDYTYSDENGDYTLHFAKNNYQSIIIEASSLGFTAVSREIEIGDQLLINGTNFTLEEKMESLKEVIVEGHQKIRINSDTTFIRVSQYATDAEQTVEDLLKRLPGIDVLPDGTIKAHGKPIESLLVEGENLLDDNYKILSKNLDPKTLEEVQILDNYEDNPIFKQLLSSEKVALNLKLKDKFKYVLFGNISGGYGLKDRYETALTLGLLRKRIKLLEFSNLNNIGSKAANLLHSEKTVIDLSQMFQKIEKKPFTIFSLDEQEENIFNSRSIFNTSMLHSIGTSTKISDELTLRGNVNIISDRTSQNYQALTQYFTGASNLSYFENSSYRNNNRIGSSELEFKFSPNSKNYFSNTLNYNLNPHEAVNTILWDNNKISQENDVNTETFYNHFEHTYLLAKNRAVYNYIYFGYGDSSEKARIFHPGLNDLFGTESGETYYQNVGNNFNYYGLQSTLLAQSKKWENYLQFHVHNEEEAANSRIFTETEQNFEDYTNNLKINNFFVAISNSLKYKLADDNFLKGSVSFKENWFNNGVYLLKNTNVTLRHKLKHIGVVRVSYNYKEELPGLRMLLPQYALNSYQSFISGSNEIKKLKNSIFSFNYSLYNDLKGFSINASVLHTITYSGYSSNAFANENFIFNSLIPASKGQTSLANLAFTNYFSKLKLATNLETNQSLIRAPLFIDGTREGNLKNYSGDYSFSVSSYFNKWFNFSSGITYRYSSSEFRNNSNTFTTTNAFSNFDLKIIEAIKITINNELYIQDNEPFTFINAKIIYEPKQKRWSGSLNINNLLNEREYLIQSFSSFKSYQKRINLLPAYALLSVKYRF